VGFPACGFHPLPASCLKKIFNSSRTAILLETGLPCFGRYNSYLFTNPVKTLSAGKLSEILPLLNEIHALSAKYWICGYLSYEAGYAFEDLPKSYPGLPCYPLAWFGVFKKPFVFNHCTGSWDRLPERTGENTDLHLAPKPAGIIPKPIPKISLAEYTGSINRIRRYIASGDTYQVNYTFDMQLAANHHPFDDYLRIRSSQPAAYCSFISHEFGHIASFSPELFFDINKSKISVKPMKGTAARGRFASEDKSISNFLATDPKNRAENLMIVDLLRNDLGRICRTKSVKTPVLFEIEKHPTLFQMTSTVTGILKREITFADIISAIFPCGSITGAPKIRTMEIIAELEKGCRGVYTGAIGFISPQKKAVFSVPIRTLHKPHSAKTWQFRVGGGIVWDSRPKSEWQECMIKSRFLTASIPEFKIVEAMHFKNNRISFLKEHLQRMSASAQYFSFPFQQKTARQFILDSCENLPVSNTFKIRFLIDKQGLYSFEFTEIFPRDSVFTGKLLISPSRTDSSCAFMFHKTTHRPWYEKAMANARKGKCLDTVFLNKSGEIAECSTNNIFVEKKGTLYTPPITSGLLPGILRANLIKTGKCREKVLYLKDLHKADAIYCGNSVRGLVRVQFL
jgi:para-aminobenzoate synthetase/4-amino-4-deoxychorismate lyase